MVSAAATAGALSIGESRRKDKGVREMEPSTAEVLAHYGYPEDLSQQKPGITFGYAKPDKAFGWLEQMKDFVPYMDRTKKVRVAFEYDPDFPMALLVIEGMKKPSED